MLQRRNTHSNRKSASKVMGSQYIFDALKPEEEKEPFNLQQLFQRTGGGEETPRRLSDGGGGQLRADAEQPAGGTARARHAPQRPPATPSPVPERLRESSDTARAVRALGGERTPRNKRESEGNCFQERNKNVGA